MTIHHFGNCLALAYVPYYLTYKITGLSEYGAFWKCVQAGCLYMVTQLAKMLFLATFFPAGSDEGFEEGGGYSDGGGELPFNFITEFLKSTVDLVDLLGIYLVMQRVAGKGHVKVMVAGLGWSFAELLFTRVVFLWFGAKGVEFDWRYIQNSFDANISLVHYLTLSCLVWLWLRRDLPRSLLPVLAAVIGFASYKTLLIDSLSDVFGLAAWTALLYKATVSTCLGLVTLQLFAGATANDKY